MLLLQRARHYKRTRHRSRQQKHKLYVSKEPAFCSKQQNTHFTVRRQTMLTLVSNSRNLCSASPSFRHSDCKHTAFFSICVENALNTRLETKERNRSARRPMPLHKGHHKDKQGDYNDEFRSARQHTTTQHQSTSCSGSKRLSTPQIADTSHSNSPPLEVGVFKVECTTEIRPQTPLDTNLDQRSTEGEQAGSQRFL